MSAGERVGVCFPRGFRAAGVTCGIKASGAADLALLACDGPAMAAGAFTRSRLAAAPVLLSREHLADGRARAVVVNSGNANACTGAQGMGDARSMAAATARALGIATDEVVVCSTGVIGEAAARWMRSSRASPTRPARSPAAAARPPPTARSAQPTPGPRRAPPRSRCAAVRCASAPPWAGRGMIRPDVATHDRHCDH